MGTKLIYSRSFNNFESSLILQFLKCFETTKTSLSKYDPYRRIKQHFCHVYHFTETATWGVL